ncbi:TetR/AcrR family transcriptional regulator [Bradyrhizobium elkanii]|nr:TetR/AcrR family transcriptional regulator [Bradyrhizobium elkanii]
MPRVIKHPDVRRSEILDWAQRVFLSRGYDNASLNDVIAEAGLSKGAFYHYYSSKEQLLEALAGRFAQSAYEAVRSVLQDASLDPLERLRAFVDRSWNQKIETAPVQWRLFEAFYRPENLVLYQRVTLAWAALFRPALSQLIADGVARGVFDTFDAESVADLFMNLPMSTYPILAEIIASPAKDRTDELIDRLDRRLRLYGIAIDRVLGLPDGSVPLANIQHLRALIDARDCANNSSQNRESGLRQT